MLEERNDVACAKLFFRTNDFITKKRLDGLKLDLCHEHMILYEDERCEQLIMLSIMRDIQQICF